MADSYVKDDISITVFRGSPPNNAYVWSPFVTKLEARLRFDGVNYRSASGSPKTAPRGKIPYIEVRNSRDGDSGRPQAMSDSTLIAHSLVANGVLHDLNAALTPARRAHDLAVRALLEDRAYFYGTREKWCDNYPAMRDGVLAAVPWPIRALVGWLAYRGVSSALYGQGTGRLEDEEVLHLKKEAWESINALLEESMASRVESTEERDPFWVLGGPEPTEADATVYGFIVGALVCTA